MPAAMASGLPLQRAGLIDGAERGDVIHEVGAAAVRADGQAAADDFAEAGEVGVDIEIVPGRRRWRGGSRS